MDARDVFTRLHAGSGLLRDATQARRHWGSNTKYSFWTNWTMSRCKACVRHRQPSTVLSGMPCLQIATSVFATRSVSSSQRNNETICFTQQQNMHQRPCCPLSIYDIAYQVTNQLDQSCRSFSLFVSDILLRLHAGIGTASCFFIVQNYKYPQDYTPHNVCPTNNPSQCPQLREAPAEAL